MRLNRFIIRLVAITVLFSCCLPFSSALAEGPVPMITKNPTSEAIAIGGKTWFIAHADNAVSLTWRCVDKDGFSVSLEDALAQHPGLTLEVLEDDTIAVGNIPLSFDGWGIQARFDGIGGGNFDVTEPAIITVQQ